MTTKEVNCKCGKELGGCEINCLKCECYCERGSLCCGNPPHEYVEDRCSCGEASGFECSLHGCSWSAASELCPAVEAVTA